MKREVIDTQDFRHTPAMGEISGFGGDYEIVCQDMLSAGVDWLYRQGQKAARKPRLNSDDEKYLSRVIINASKGECTGAMHDNIMSKLSFIAKFGWAEYCNQMRLNLAKREAVLCPPEDQPVEGVSPAVGDDREWVAEGKLNFYQKLVGQGQIPAVGPIHPVGFDAADPTTDLSVLIVTPQEFADPVIDSATAKVRSYGDNAVGRNFNPSGNPTVDEIKSLFSYLIDIVHRHRNETPDPETKRLCSVAITETQTAQMWAVKAITFG